MQKVIASSRVVMLAVYLALPTLQSIFRERREG